LVSPLPSPNWLDDYEEFRLVVDAGYRIGTFHPDGRYVLGEHFRCPLDFTRRVRQDAEFREALLEVLFGGEEA